MNQKLQHFCSRSPVTTQRHRKMPEFQVGIHSEQLHNQTLLFKGTVIWKALFAGKAINLSLRLLEIIRTRRTAAQNIQKKELDKRQKSEW